VAAEDRKASQEALRLAAEAHQRGREHLSACQRHHASFATLQAEVNEATTEQLRSSRGKPDLSMFEGRIADRTKAELQLNAAIESERLFLAEHGQAVTRLQETEAAYEAALTALIDHASLQFDEEISRLSDRLAALKQAKYRSRDRAPWFAVVERLKQDPMGADLNVTVADTPEPDDPPTPAIPMFVHRSTIRTVLPLDQGGGTSEPMDIVEFDLAQRRAMLEVAGEKPLWLRQQLAVEASRKPLGGD
jgi:hypothetical protein